MNLNRRAFLQSALAAAAAAVMPVARAEEALTGDVGVVPRFAINLDVARNEDAAVATLMRVTPTALIPVPDMIARLEAPQSYAQVEAWVRGLTIATNARQIFVQAPRPGELEIWHKQQATRAERERVTRAILDEQQRRWIEAFEREQASRPRVLVPRREQLRRLMRERMAGWRGNDDSLVAAWRRMS
jgi:hypothetical protein